MLGEATDDAGPSSRSLVVWCPEGSAEAILNEEDSTLEVGDEDEAGGHAALCVEEGDVEDGGGLSVDEGAVDDEREECLLPTGGDRETAIHQECECMR